MNMVATSPNNIALKPRRPAQPRTEKSADNPERATKAVSYSDEASTVPYRAETIATDGLNYGDPGFGSAAATQAKQPDVGVKTPARLSVTDLLNNTNGIHMTKRSHTTLAPAAPQPRPATPSTTPVNFPAQTPSTHSTIRVEEAPPLSPLSEISDRTAAQLEESFRDDIGADDTIELSHSSAHPIDDNAFPQKGMAHASSEVKAGAKRRRQDLTDSEKDEDSGEESEHSPPMDTGAIDPKNILEPTARRAAIAANAKRTTKVETRAAAKTINKIGPALKRNERVVSNRVTKSTIKRVKTMKTRQNNVESDADEFELPTSPLLPIIKSLDKNAARLKQKTLASDEDGPTAKDVTATLRKNLADRDREIKALKNKNIQLNKAADEIKERSDVQRKQMLQVLAGQKVWYTIMKHHVKMRDAEWLPAMEQGMIAGVVVDPVARQEASVEALGEAKKIMGSGGPGGMAKHIKGYHAGDLSDYRNSDEYNRLDDVDKEEHEEVAKKNTGTTNGRDETSDDGSTTAGVDGSDDETQEIIDLTMSSPIQASSLIPTSSPDRAEYAILRTSR